MACPPRQVQTPLLSTMLVDDELEIMRDLAARCCPNATEVNSPFCQQVCTRPRINFASTQQARPRPPASAPACFPPLPVSPNPVTCTHPPSANLSQALPAALAPGHDASDDLCHLPPITCTNEGRLQQLSLPGAGLDCRGAGLPPTFAGLGQLQVLDLAFNDIGGGTDDLADILNQVTGSPRTVAAPLPAGPRLPSSCARIGRG
jgi:hypothetical protein